MNWRTYSETLGLIFVLSYAILGSWSCFWAILGSWCSHRVVGSCCQLSPFHSMAPIERSLYGPRNRYRPLQGLVQKEISLQKGEIWTTMRKFWKESRSVVGWLLSIICHRGSCGRYMISTLSICATILPRRHNLCISFTLLLIFLHRHQPKQCHCCRRE